MSREKQIYRILVMRIQSQYNALGVFEEELIENWERLGMVVESIDQYDADSLKRAAEQDYDLIFMMNGAVFSLRSEMNWLEEYFKKPIYTYYVDHPLHIDLRIRQSDTQHCIVVDRDFKDYMDRHYHNLLHETELVMQAGVEGMYSNRLFEERRYPVVFCGSYGDYHAILERINQNKRSFQIFLHYMIGEALNKPALTIEEIYDRALEHFQFPLSEEEYTEFLYGCRDVELYLRAYYRAMIIKQILEAGIPVEIYGNNWEQLDCNRKDLLHCHAPIDYREMPDVFADAQIVINVMPWAKAGFHDRIACAMLNGAMVISDETAYMKEQALDGNRLVVYSLQALYEVPQKVAYYLEHLDEAKTIAQNGYEWAKENHTWRNRAEQFLRIFDKNRKLGTEENSLMDNSNPTFDISTELEGILTLWQKYLPVLFRFQQIGVKQMDRDFSLDFFSQMEELAGYTADLKNMCCNGGGMIWIEKRLTEGISLLRQYQNEGRYEDTEKLLDDIIVYTEKMIAQLQELLSSGLYDINFGKMTYKKGIDVAKLGTIEEAVNALNPDSMNPLEHFFFLEPHNKMTKWSHYFEVYHRHFERFRNQPVTVLEIGVWGGGSLQMWKKYFGNRCNIIGIDIMEECKDYEEEQIKIYIGSQEDREFLQKIKAEIPKVDIIIDDGGHTMNQQIITFEELFPILADGGVYLCEDTHTSYWSDFEGGYRKPDTFLEYSKNFIDRLHARYSLSADLKTDDFTRAVRSIHYYDSMVVLEKGGHKPSMPFWI